MIGLQIRRGDLHTQTGTIALSVRQGVARIAILLAPLSVGIPRNCHSNAVRERCVRDARVKALSAKLV